MRNDIIAMKIVGLPWTTWVAKMSLSLNPLSNGTVLALLRGWGVSLQRIEKLDMRHTF